MFSSMGLVLFKLGGKTKALIKFSNGILNLNISLTSLIGLLCYAFSFLLYLILVSKFNLSKIYPITTGIIFICVMVASVLLLKEQVTMTSLLGSALILVGVILIISF